MTPTTIALIRALIAAAENQMREAGTQFGLQPGTTRHVRALKRQEKADKEWNAARAAVEAKLKEEEDAK